MLQIVYFPKQFKLLLFQVYDYNGLLVIIVISVFLSVLFFPFISSFTLFLGYIAKMLVEFFVWLDSCCVTSYLAVIDVGPFCSEKYSYSLFPVDGVSVLMTFLKNQCSTLSEFILQRANNSSHTAWIELNSGPCANNVMK